MNRQMMIGMLIGAAVMYLYLTKFAKGGGTKGGKGRARAGQAAPL